MRPDPDSSFHAGQAGMSWRHRSTTAEAGARVRSTMVSTSGPPRVCWVMTRMTLLALKGERTQARFPIGTGRYELTPLGATLIDPIHILTEWARANGDAVLDALDAGPEPVTHSD